MTAWLVLFAGAVAVLSGWVFVAVVAGLVAAVRERRR